MADDRFGVPEHCPLALVAFVSVAREWQLQIELLHVFEDVVGGLLELAEFVGGQF